MAEERKPPGWLLPVAGALVVVLLVVAGLLRDTLDLDPSTPEGVVQDYLEAVFAGDQETAAEFTEGECDPNLGPGVPVDGVSASLVSVERGDTQTTVVVKLSEPSSDPIGGLIEWEEWFNLINHDGVWVIQQPVWPYYGLEC